MSVQKYVDFDPRQGYLRAADLFYECQQCHKVLPSIPDSNVWCDCYNLMVDIDAGRLGVQNESQVKLIRECE